MHNHSPQLREEMKTQLGEEWGVADEDVQQRMLRSISRNLSSLNKRLTQKTESGDWFQAAELSETAAAFAANIKNSRLQEINQELIQAVQNKDTMHCLATLEYFHRAIAELQDE